MTATLGIVSGILSLGGLVEWGRRVVAVRVPEDRSVFVGVMAVAFVLGVFALVSDASGIARAGAWTGAIGGGLFLFLVALSKQDEKTPAVSIGAAVLDFSGTDEDGNEFALASLRGRPFLLKFFRGHW